MKIQKMAIVAGLMFGLMTGLCAGQTCPELTGRWPYGPAYAVAVQGNYAYYGSGTILMVDDVSDPAHPSTIGNIILPDLIFDVAISGLYAYVADYEAGLRVIDISNPANSFEAGFLVTSGHAYGVAVSPGYVYLAAQTGGMRIIDVSNPATPVEVGFYENGNLINGIAVSGIYAYITDYDRLRVLDISEPTSPFEVGFLPIYQAGPHLAVSGNYAYVPAGEYGLHIVDISNPAVPIEAGFYVAPYNNMASVSMSGDYAAVADYNYGLRFIDISNAASPVERGACASPGFAMDAKWSGNFVFLADNIGGLRIVDASNPTTPTEIGFHETPDAARQVAVSGNRLYVAEYDAGLYIINISNPASPYQEGYYNTPGHALGVASSGQYAYVADADGGLRILDVSVPSAPLEVGFFLSSNEVWDVAVAGNYAYLAELGSVGGLRIVDVSNPAAPSEVGSYDGHTTYTVVVSGPYAYLSDYDSLLRIIDVSNPALPFEVGNYGTGTGGADDIAVSDGFAYVILPSYGLDIVDISNPSLPVEAGFIAGTFPSVSMAGRYAFLTRFDYGLQIVDVSTPSSPVEIGSHDTPGYAVEAAVSGQLVYIAEFGAGVEVFDASSCCTAPPSAFLLQSPADTATCQPVQITLDWQDSAQAMAYDLFLDTITPPVAQVGMDLPASEFTVTLNPDVTYYWSVTAKNGCGTTSSGPWSFTTTPGIPAPFNLLTPAGSATGIAPNVTLDWQDSANASSYNLYFGTSSPPPEYQTSLATSRFDLTGLLSETTYYWFVRAVNSCGTTDSAEWSFTTTCAVEESWWPGGFYGGAWSVRANGNYVYFANGQYLVTADVSAPGNPVKTSEILLSGAIGEGVMAVSGNYLYVSASTAGLRVFDISAPATPVEAAFLDTPGSGWGEVEISGTTLYLGDGNGGLRIINIADPLNPSEIGFFMPSEGPSGAGVRAVALTGNYAFITDYNYGVLLVDISNPSAPVEVPSGFIEVAGGMESLDIYGTALYAADFNAGLRIFDITDPLNPVEQTPYPLDQMEWVFVQGARAYVPDSAMGLYILDLTTPLAPVELGHWDSPGNAAHVDVAGNTAYLADDTTGLRKLDISNPAAITEVGFLDESYGSALGVAVQGNYAYASYYMEGLRIFDISNPAAPAPVFLFSPPACYIRDVFVEGNRAYVADQGGFLRILDISNPAAPVQLGTFAGAGRAIELAGTYAYYAIGRWLRIIDVSDPANPVEVGAWNSPVGGQAIQDLTVGDGFVYLAVGDAGLRIVNVTDPRHPFETSFVNTPGYAYGVAYAEGSVLLADGASGVRLYNVSNPSNPVEISVYDTPGSARRVMIAGVHILVSDTAAGLRLLDYSDALNPVEAGAYDTPWPGDTQETALSGTHAVLADYFGIRIVDLAACCTTPAGAFQLTSPLDGDAQDTCSITLDWEDAAQALSYDLYLGTGGPMTLARSGIALSHVQVDLNPGLTYQWYVVARNSCGDSTSSTRSFTTGGAPGAFNLLAPADGSTDRAGSLLLRWEESPGAETYNFYGGYAPDPPLIQSGITQAVFDARGIPPGTTVYWRVEAVNSCGVTSSNEWHFTTSCIGETARFPGGYYGASRSSIYIGNYLYVGNGPYLQILDVADPSNPALVNEILLNDWIDEGVMLLDGSILYVPVQTQGIVIYDVSDPVHPVRLSTFDTPGSLNGGMEKQGNLLYVADIAGVAIVDVSDPDNPAAFGYYTPSGIPGLIPRIRDVALSGNILYVADLYYVLWIVDVSDPASPVEITHYELEQYPESLIASGGALYLAGGVDDPATQAGLLIYDISTTPQAPLQVGAYFDLSYPEWIELSGALLYMADSVSGLRILDVSDPAAPSQIGQFTNDNLSAHAALSGSRAALTQDYAGVTLLDITAPTNPEQTGGFDQSHGAYLSVAVSGATAYAAALSEGVVVLDLTDPATPVQAGAYQTACYMMGVDVDGTRLYASDWACGLFIYDITSPLAPAYLGTASYSARAAALQDDYAYVASNRRLRILDVSDPTAPVQTAAFVLPEHPQDVAVSGRYAYVADGSSGLYIFDVIDPSSPVQASRLDTAGLALGVAVSDGYAYVADGAEGLRIIDVSNPANPVEAAFFDTPGYARKITLSGSFAFLSDNQGLYVLDVSVPASPVLTAHYGSDGGPHMQSAMLGNRAVAADYYNMDVLDVAGCLTQGPGAFVLFSPADWAQSVSCRAALDWQNSPYALNYDVYVDTVNPPATLAASGVFLSEFRLTLNPNTTYWWKVVAKSPGGSDVESEVWSFTTGNPGAFNLLSPANGAVNQPGTLNLDWQDSVGTASYRLYLGTTQPPAPYSSYIGQSAVQVTGLAANTLYYWYVEAVNECGAAPSRTWQFRTGVPNLEYSSHGFSDACASGGAGNGDGKADPGEQITLTVLLANTGLTNATNISAVLSTATPGVAIYSDFSTYPNLPFGGPPAPSQNPYLIEIDESVPCGTMINFIFSISADQGGWSDSFQVRVGNPAGTVLREDFETWPPAGWAIFNNGGDCVWQDNATTGKPNYAGGDGNAAAADSDACGFGTTMDTELRSPIFDLSFAQSAALNFIASYADILPGAEDNFRVDLSTDGGNNWTNLLTWNEDHNPAGPGEAVNLDLTPHIGSSQTQVRFHYSATNWHYWAMADQVEITASPYCTTCVCVPPGGFILLTPGDGFTGATPDLFLDWEDAPGVSTYELYFGTSSPPPLLQSGLTASRYDLTDLANETTFFWFVRAVNGCGTSISPTFSFTTTCMSETSRWPALPYGPSRAVALNGNYVYLGTGRYLQTLDVSDPAAPVKTDEFLLPDYQDEGQILLSGGYAYVCNSRQLIIFDLSDPAHPVQVNTYAMVPTLRSGMTIAAGRAYVCSEGSGLYILDLSNPAAPSPLGFIPIAMARDVEVAGTTAYIVDAYDGLRIYDVADPASPVELGFFPGQSGYAEGLALVGNTVLFADGAYGLLMVDVSTPSAPVQIGFLPALFWMEWIEVSGSLAFIPEGRSGLRIVDISDPSNPFQVGLADTPGNAFSMAVGGGFAYVADDAWGLRVVDVNDPSAPFEIGAHDESTSQYLGLGLSGTTAYLASRLEGVQVMDINDPSNPTPGVMVGLPGSTLDVIVSGNRAYAAGEVYLTVLDISTPSSPTVMGSYPTPAWDVAPVENLAYVATRTNGLRILDAADPANIGLVGQINLPGGENGVTVDGPYAYVTCSGGGLRIVDVSDPWNPIPMGFITFGDIARDVVVAEGRAYVAAATAGLRIVDIGDPNAPVEIGSFDTPGSANRVHISGSAVFVSAGGSGVRIVDVSNPWAPFEIGAYNTAISASDAEMSGNHLIIADDLEMTIADFGGCFHAPPDAVQLLQPPDAQVGQYCSVMLDWENAPLALRYDVYLDTVNPPVTMIASGVALSHYYASLNQAQTYYWRIVAHNPAGTTASAVWSFTTGTPGPFVLIAPPNGAGNQPSTLDLDWGDSDGAEAYDLYLGASANPPLYQSDIGGSSFQVSGLAASTTYTWYVVSKNGCGTRTSQKFQFTTGAVQLDYQNHTFTDTCFAGGPGSGNGIAEPGETVELFITLVNNGPGIATGIQAVLSTTTPGVTITQDTAAYPNIPGNGGSAPSLTPFGVSIAPTVPCMTMMQFVLQITSNEGMWPAAFQMPVGQGTAVLLNETFETWPPAGLQIVHYGGSCDWDSTANTLRPNYAGGNGSAADADSDWCQSGMDTALRTPPMDLPWADSITLSFIASYHDALPGDDRFTVEISTDGGGNWTNLLMWDEDHDPFGPGEGVNLDLTPYAGARGVLVQIRYAASGWYWWAEVDDVRIEASNACWSCCQPRPFNLLSPADQATEVPHITTLDWEDSPGATSYNLYLGTSTPPPLYKNGIPISQYQVYDLEGHSTYYWRVEAVNSCGNALSPEFSFTTPCVDLVGRWPYGPAWAVAVQGNFAYFGSGPTLIIADVSNPSVPIKVSEVRLSDIVSHIVVSGSYIYVANGDFGLKILDVSNPLSPFETGHCDTPGGAIGVAVSGSYAYIADYWQGLRIVDISNPAAPFEVGYFDAAGTARGVSVLGPYAYVADETEGLRIVDISNPAAPFEVGSFNTPSAVRVMAIDDYAYVADSGTGLHVVNITNPAAPFEVGSYLPPGPIYGLDITGEYAYIADEWQGLRIVDISNPSTPFETGFVVLSGPAIDVASSGNYAYVADDEDGIRIINVSDPSSPVGAGFYDTPGSASGVAVAGIYAYLGDGYSGLRIIDISNPSVPVEVGSFDTPGYAMGVAIANTYAYVVDYYAGMRIVDISNPTSPFEAGYYDTPGTAYAIAISGTYAYVADEDAGLRIINISNPSAPFEAGYYDTPGYSIGVAISDAHAYIADWYGLRIVDISNPSAPVGVGFYDTPGIAFGVAVSGGYAYVACDHMGLRVVDVSNPSAPFEVGYYDSPGYAQSVSISGMYAFLSDWSLRVVNISDPAAPYEVDNYGPGGAYGYSMAISNGYVFAPIGYLGMGVYDVSLCCSDSPITFDLMIPANGAPSQASPANLDWQDSPGSLNYDLYLDTVNPPLVLAGSNLPVSEFQATLSPGTTYYWRVVAKNGCGTTESATWSFTTTSGVGPMEVPKGTVRASKAGSDITLTWGATCGAASDYIIYEGTIAALRTGAYDHGTKVCTDAGADLQETFTPIEGDTYYLIVPVNAAGIEGDYGFGRPAGTNPMGCTIVGRQAGECP